MMENFSRVLRQLTPISTKKLIEALPLFVELLISFRAFDQNSLFRMLDSGAFTREQDLPDMMSVIFDRVPREI